MSSRTGQLVTLLTAALLLHLMTPVSTSTLYIGCLEDLSPERNFTLSPGDYNPESLAEDHLSCLRACRDLPANFSGVWQAKFCFCANSTEAMASSSLPANNCTDSEHLAVYRTDVPSVDHLEVSTTGEILHLYNAGSVTVSTNDASQSLGAVRITYGDDRNPIYWTELTDQLLNTNKSWHQPGVMNIRAQVLSDGVPISQAAKQVITGQLLAGSNFTCPDKWVTFESMETHVILEAGTGVKVSVDWADGTNEAFLVADESWQRAGSPVSTTIHGLQSQQGSSGLFLSGAEFTAVGWLKSFEFFASVSGTIALIVFRPMCSDASESYCTRLNICSTNAICSQTIELNATAIGPKLSANQAMNISWVQTKVAVQPGYNQFFLHTGDFFKVLPGDRIGFQANESLIMSTPKAAADNADLMLSNSTSSILHESKPPGDWVPLQVRHQISAVARPLTAHRVLLNKTYQTASTYNVSVNLSQLYDASSFSSSSCTIWVQEGINFTIIKPKAYVKAMEMVTFELEPHTGSEITYNWTFSSGGENTTNVPSVNYTFTEEGNVTLHVTAYTTFQSLSNSTSFFVYIPVLIDNAEVEGQPFGNSSTISILLKYQNASQVTCAFNISVGPSTVFENVPMNGTVGRISRQSELGVYNVHIECSNPYDSDTKEKLLYVEIPVTHLTIVTEAARVGTAFHIEYLLHNCSNPKVTIEINGVQKMSREITGSAGPFTVNTLGRQTVNATARNNVSSISLQKEIVILQPIVNVAITVDNPSIAIGNEVEFTLNMQSGSGLTISITYDNGPIALNFTNSQDPWNRSMSFRHNFTDGGSHTVIANVSNLLNYSQDSVNVKVRAPLGDLALNSPPGAAMGQPVQFSIASTPSSGYPVDTTVTFSWGDGSGDSTWDVINSTDTTFSHTFNTIGRYNVCFVANNILSNATNCTSITIVIPITNPSVEFTPPVVVKREIFTARVRLDAGSSLNITLHPCNDNTDMESATAGSTIDLSCQFNSTGIQAVQVTICNVAGCQGDFRHNLTVVNRISAGTTNMTHNGPQLRLGDKLNITITYNGSTDEEPTGSKILILDQSNSAVDQKDFDINSPVTFVIDVVTAGYHFFSAFIYNNGSNITLYTGRIGVYDDIVFNNVTILYRLSNELQRRPGFGEDNSVFPGNTDIVVEPYFTGFVAEYRLLVGEAPLSWPSNWLSNQTFNDSANIYQRIGGTGNYQVLLMAWNPLSSFNHTINITIGGAIVNGRFKDRDGVTKPGFRRRIDLEWDMVSSDTCVKVDLDLEGYKFIFGPESCATGCLGPINGTEFNVTNVLVQNNVLSFSVPYSGRPNSYKISAVACNDFVTFTYNAVIAVSYSNCRPPIVSMMNPDIMNHQSPMVALRSQMVVVECVIQELNCPVTLQNERQWEVLQLNQSNMQVMRSVDVSQLATYRNTILALPKHFLDIGLYSVVAKVTMNISITKEEFSSTTVGYLRIVNSPLLISFTQGGMSLVRKGIRHEVCLNPYLHSVDPDVANREPEAQGIGSWVYHCYTGNDTAPGLDSRDPVQNPHSEAFNFSEYEPPVQGCFGAPSGYVNITEGRFCFSGRELRVNTTYSFRVQGFKGDRSGEATIRLYMVDASPVEVNVRCLSSVDCTPITAMPGYQRVNPSDVVQLVAFCGPSGTEACTDNLWTMEYLDAVEWRPVPETSSRLYIDGAIRTEVTLLPQLFTSVVARQFRICLTSQQNTESEGQGCILLLTNTAPRAGVCNCNGTRGIAGMTVFRINCTGFSDTDSIDTYHFLRECSVGERDPIDMCHSSIEIYKKQK